MPPRALRAAVLLAAAPLLLLAGCAAPAPAVTVTVTAGAPGGSADAPAQSVTPAAQVKAACPILTQEEAGAIVGTKLGTGSEGNPLDPSCQYDSDPNAGKTAQVRVLIGGGAQKTYQLDHDELKHTFKDVAGIGDEAHQEDFAIFFRKGSTWGGITVVLLDDPSTVVTQLQDAAKVVVSRLP